MTHCCSQCAFTAQFESALMMHKQLHHATTDDLADIAKGSKLTPVKSNTMPRCGPASSSFSVEKTKSSKTHLGRSSSATRLFDKLRARICRSRTLFSHPEETADITVNDVSLDALNETVNELQTVSKMGSPVSRKTEFSTIQEAKETFGCHLCSFEADRITVLDRHLLNDHKIGLENLLKLVMAKTKDGLSDDIPSTSLYGIRQPYYRLPNEIIEEGEFVIETVTPKVKILKHASTNTDLRWSDIPDLKDNCKVITQELEEMMKTPIEKCDKEFLVKMQTLNDYMCKFVDSSNTLKKVLKKGLDSKNNVREHPNLDQPFFDLCLGDARSSRVWDRARSEQMDRTRNKYTEGNRGDKKLTSESFYF